jgi:uncharacterized protein YcaQ
MSRSPVRPLILPPAQARRIWLSAQGLDREAPFGAGRAATPAAIEQLGYVQIDTINVIERCHHHILFTRIPDYRRADLRHAQTVEKSVFEYWTHALAYVPTADFRFFIRAMKAQRANPHRWFGSVTKGELLRMRRRLLQEGPLTIRDIDEEPVEKTHLWASRKPSKRVLQLAFFMGYVTVSARAGMLKTYELTERHFGWEKPPPAASEREINAYLVDRALRAQGIVSLDSIAFGDLARKKAIHALIEKRVSRGELTPVAIAGAERLPHWVRADSLEAVPGAGSELAHVLSPFDPLIIQRKRLKLFFGYEHRFEAYVPKDKRVFGYFALPVLIGDEIVAAIDLKADRVRNKLLVQRWTWVGAGRRRAHKRAIEESLSRFADFQFAT